MNVDDNHLVSSELFAEMDQEEQEKYDPVPEQLERAAHMKLAGELEAHVSFKSGGKLSKWARKKREEKKRKAMSGKL